jgi:hypothetical protein
MIQVFLVARLCAGTREVHWNATGHYIDEHQTYFDISYCAESSQFVTAILGLNKEAENYGVEIITF